MKKVLMLLFCGLISASISFAQTPPPAAPVTTPVAVKPMHHEKEKHPEIHKAIRKLKGAKEDLDNAAHDYSGHRVKAIEAINRALEELRAALEYDKK